MNIIIVMAIAAAAAVAAFAVCDMLLTPVRSTEGTEVYALVVISGDAEGLEETVRGLSYLSDRGMASLRLIVADSSASPDAKMRARLICQNNDGLVTDVDALSETVKDIIWRKPDTQT